MSNFLLQIPHRRQQSDWDCGMTCVQMLIDFYRIQSTSNDEILRSYQCNQSTWTIDLLHLLHQVGIPSTLQTMTIGCANEFNNLSYYRSLIDQDRQRVNKLFEIYKENVKLGSVTSEELKEHLIKHQQPCLVLIDANQITCSTCRRSLLLRIAESIQHSFLSYQGHYVILAGFETKDGKEFVRYIDPGRNDHICQTNRENFDRARKAFGTDEDLIFCYKKVENN